MGDRLAEIEQVAPAASKSGEADNEVWDGKAGKKARTREKSGRAVHEFTAF